MPLTRSRRARAQRLSSITPFHVMALLSRARELEAQGRSVVHMEIGEPDFASPQPIVEAGIRALQAGKTHYTPAVGLAELRHRIAQHYGDTYGVTIDPRRILITPGASGALQLILGLLVDPGSEVVMTDPGYPCNRHMVSVVGGEAVPVPVAAEDGYRPRADVVATLWDSRIRGLMVATPANPTGSVLGRTELAELAELAGDRKQRLGIISRLDAELKKQGRHLSALLDGGPAC